MDTAVKPRGCTNLKLRQLLRQVGGLYDAEVGKAGLKTTQYSLLSYVCKLGPLRPVDLAAVLRMSASTLSRNLQPVLAAGWVEQLPGPDGRSRLIQATTAGREKRAEAQRRWKVAQEQLNATLGVQRVLALHTLIDDCSALLAPAPEEDEA